MKEHASKIFAIGAALLLAGCFPFSIGYYTFLRIAVFVISIVGIALVYEKKQFWQIAGLVILAILFNPVLPIYLHSKAAWIAIDAFSAIFVAILAYVTHNEK